MECDPLAGHGWVGHGIKKRSDQGWSGGWLGVGRVCDSDPRPIKISGPDASAVCPHRGSTVVAASSRCGLGHALGADGNVPGATARSAHGRLRPSSGSGWPIDHPRYSAERYGGSSVAP